MINRQMTIIPTITVHLNNIEAGVYHHKCQIIVQPAEKLLQEIELIYRLAGFQHLACSLSRGNYNIFHNASVKFIAVHWGNKPDRTQQMLTPGDRNAERSALVPGGIEVFFPRSFKYSPVSESHANTIAASGLE